jgi:hypothetical protein
VKCRDMQEIMFSKKAWKKAKKNHIKRPVMGLDTETEKGKAFVMGMYDGKEFHAIALKSFDDFVAAIIKHKLDQTSNFFYNLTYDTNALIKHLPYNVLEELAAMDEVEYKGIKMKIIPEKLLQLKIGKKTYQFFDEAQFFNKQRLTTVGQKLFGIAKVEQDVTDLKAYRYFYDKQYRDELDHYLQRDCELCYRLGEHLFEITEKYLVPKYFYSQASFSQQYFLENMQRDYMLQPRTVMDYALKAYNGGRFEVFKRGTFKDVSAWDIRSAYPYQNVKIPALDTGKWTKTNKYDPDADISLFKAVAFGKSHISPMKAENAGLIYYPTGNKTMYINKTEYETLRLYNYKVKILSGYHYHTRQKEYPFTFLKDFYEEKERVGKESPEYMFYKIIINGFYGKTIQLQRDKYLTEENGKAVDFAIINKKLKGINERFKAGLLFNPIVAQEITGNTRSMLLDSVVDIQDSVIAFATDSVIGMKRPNIKIGKRLGEWDEEVTRKKFTSIGSGVYYFENDKMRFRGFGRGYDPDIIMNSDTDKVTLPVTRVIKLKQTFKAARVDLNSFNMIIKANKELNLNFDKKRHWFDKFNNTDEIYNKQIESAPMVVNT